MWLTNFVSANPGLCSLVYIVAFWIMISLMILLEGMSKVGKFLVIAYTAVIAYITFSSVGSYFQLLGNLN